MATVEVVYRGDAAFLYLNRPERLNAVVPTLLEELCRALVAAADNAGAVIVAGNGRAFCSGHDLKEKVDHADTAAHRRDVALAQDVTRLMRSFLGPVVAAVHGYALGAGAEIALAADFVVAARDAMFGFPEVKRGLSVTGGISHLLPRMVGLPRAKELMLLGEWVSGERAVEIGLIHSAVEAEQLKPAVAALVARLIGEPRDAFARAKRTLNAGVEGSLGQALEYEIVEAVGSRATYPGIAE